MPIRVCDDCLGLLLSGWGDHTTSRGWESRIRSKYGIDAGEHGRMFVEQKGLCAICRDPARSERTDLHGSGLVVDHDHDTGEVRGLLCGRCNTAIGLLGDNPKWVMSAAYYLRGYLKTQPAEKALKRELRQERTREHIERRRAERAAKQAAEN